MHNKKLLISLAFPLIMPIQDIFPMSVGIIIAYALYSIVLTITSKSYLNVNLLKYSFLWFVLSAFFISISLFLSLLYLSVDFSKINYLLRILLVSLSSLIIFLCFSKTELSNIKFSDLFSALFYLIIFSAFFELISRLSNFNDVLYLYKARQDLGGIDSTHFNRFTGFWSFPGDVAIIIVLSLVLLINNPVNHRTIKFFILILLLFLTQSKAGIFLFSLYCIYHIALKPSFSKVLMLFLSLSFFITFIFYFNLEYLILAFDNFDYYLYDSKRAQEIFQFLQGDAAFLFMGTPIPSDFYESEIFGSLNRTGIVGSFWFLSIVFFVFVKIFTSGESNRNYFVYLLMFLIFYCSISAGLSRLKILFPHLIFFWILFIQTSFPTHTPQIIPHEKN